MKKLLLSLFTFAILLSFTTNAQAQAEERYWGVKTGIFDAGSGVDDIIPIGFIYGIHVQDQFYFEGELNIGVAGGEFEPFPGVSGDMDLFTLGGFGVYKHEINPQWTAKGKLGLVYTDAEVTAKLGPFKVTEGNTDVGLAIGGSISYTLDERKSIELGYTIYKGSLDLLGIGINFEL